MTRAKAKKKKKLKRYFFTLLFSSFHYYQSALLAGEAIKTANSHNCSLFDVLFTELQVLNVGEEDAEKIKRF